MSGTTIANRYELGDRLGSGGMSTVYRAVDRVLERTVAVKVLAEHLSDDEKFVARFRREALAVAKLVHPNIVQVYDTGVDAGRHFIVMEYVEGRSGAQLLQRDGALEHATAVEIAAQACAGLEYAHRHGDHPPRRQAGQPDGDRRPRRRPARDDRQARRLRDRPGGRADATHAGRLGRRHRRLPVAGAVPRRGGDADLRRLLARRRHLPAADREAPLRGQQPRRAGDPPRERAAAATDQLRARTSPSRSPRPSCGRSRTSPRSATSTPSPTGPRSAPASPGSPRRRKRRPGSSTSAAPPPPASPRASRGRRPHRRVPPARGELRRRRAGLRSRRRSSPASARGSAASSAASSRS